MGQSQVATLGWGATEKLSHGQASQGSQIFVLFHLCQTHISQIRLKSHFQCMQRDVTCCSCVCWTWVSIRQKVKPTDSKHLPYLRSTLCLLPIM